MPEWKYESKIRKDQTNSIFNLNNEFLKYRVYTGVLFDGLFWLYDTFSTHRSQI